VLSTDGLRGLGNINVARGRALEIDPLGIFLGALIVGAQGLDLFLDLAHEAQTD